MRVKRSVRIMFGPEPLKLVCGVKFVVSTTSESPSQRPRESPFQRRTLLGRWSPSSVGITRWSFTISFRMAT